MAPPKNGTLNVQEWAKDNGQKWRGMARSATLADAATMIAAGTQTGAWPVALDSEPMVTASGLAVPGKAIVADYLTGNGSATVRRVLGPVGNGYTSLAVKEWNATVEAAVKAGAKPSGAFSLGDGGRVLATFEIPAMSEGSSGIKSYLLLAQGLDGSMALVCGDTVIRVVCENTLRAALRTGKEEDSIISIRHTASINDLVKKLQGQIAQAIAQGRRVREFYRQTAERKVSQAESEEIFEMLFPTKDKDGKALEGASLTKVQGKRSEIIAAAKLPVNRDSSKVSNGGSAATLYNALTWTLDRELDEKTGQWTSRKARGGADELESLLLGQRGRRLAEINGVVQKVLKIEVVMKDGTVQEMTAPEAAAHGIDERSIGRAALEGMGLA